MEYKTFLDIVDCATEDIESARHYMDVRGVEEHLIVAEYLQNYKAGKVSYREVATALRYDKRIRRILYKYIGYLEERIRAYISNRYSGKTDCLKLTYTVKNNLKTYSLYESLSEISFGQLILQSKKLTEEEKKELFSADSISHISIWMQLLSCEMKFRTIGFCFTENSGRARIQDTKNIRCVRTLLTSTIICPKKYGIVLQES